MLHLFLCWVKCYTKILWILVNIIQCIYSGSLHVSCKVYILRGENIKTTIKFSTRLAYVEILKYDSLPGIRNFISNFHFCVHIKCKNIEYGDLYRYSKLECCLNEQIIQIPSPRAYSIILETLHAYFHSIRKRKLDLRLAV